jgi:hypothetical protein
LKPKTHTPKFSRNFRPEPRKFLENFESPYKICDKVDFQSVGRRPGGPETQTNISVNGGLAGWVRVQKLCWKVLSECFARDVLQTFSGLGQKLRITARSPEIE